MVSNGFGCWEYSPFHCLALGTASPLGSTSPLFFVPISHYLISSLQDALYAFFAGKFCVLAWTAVFFPQCCQSLLATCKLLCSSESLLALQNAQGTLSGWHYCCLGF